MLAVTFNNTPLRFASGDRQKCAYARVPEEDGRVTQLLKWLLPYTLEEDPDFYNDQFLFHNKDGKPVVVYGLPYQELPETYHKLSLVA